MIVTLLRCMGVKKALLGACGVVVLMSTLRKLGCGRWTPRTNTQTMTKLPNENEGKLSKSCQTGSSGAGGGSTGQIRRLYWSKIPARDELEIWRKIGPKHLDFVGKMAKLTLGDTKVGRSHPRASDLWNKTTRNSTKREIDPKEIWGYFFFDNFRIFSKEKLGEIRGQIRGNSLL